MCVTCPETSCEARSLFSHKRSMTAAFWTVGKFLGIKSDRGCKTS